MKLKPDENIGRRGLDMLRTGGHDVATVREQGLEGARDEILFDACAREGRTLVTLDRDFGQVLRFPPERGAGVVILDPGWRITLQSLLDRLKEFLSLAREQSPAGGAMGRGAWADSHSLAG